MSEQEKFFSKQAHKLNKAWIFQALPKYNVFAALNDPEISGRIHWAVNKYDSFIKKGNKAIIWLSGKNAGIYAIGEVVINPSIMRDTEAEQKYWIGDVSEFEKTGLKTQVILK